MKKSVRIGGASAFWGDSSTATEQLVLGGDVDYLMYDYLAELTMAIMAKQRDRNENAGFAIDFVDHALKPVLSEVVRRKIKLVSNAGGVNPEACATRLASLAEQEGVKLSIAVVSGDDLMPLEQSLRQEGTTEMWTGDPLPDELACMNAYIGAFPIAEALRQGADVVITGRCADSALALGILIHEFGWTVDDYDRLAAGSLVGHLLECGTQVTGGIFTDWEDVSGRTNLGYPIAECFTDGTFKLTKPDGTGGMIAPLVASEQMLYEIGDPKNYLLPDVTADFSQVQISQEDSNTILLRSARGRPPTDTYKVSAVYKDGYRASTTLTMVGGNATKKAETIGAEIIERVSNILRKSNLGEFSEVNIETLGSENTFFGENARDVSPREVVLRVSIRHPAKEAVSIFAREIAPFGTGGTPGTTGFSGRPQTQQVYRLFSFLIDKKKLGVRVAVDGEEIDFQSPVPRSKYIPADTGNVETAETNDGDLVRVPLRSVAIARSGDKADVSHLAIISRDEAFFDVIKSRVTERRMKAYFDHLVDGKVERFDVPGISAVNFLLYSALGGGGTVSLRSDALGKAFGEIALDMEIDIPRRLTEHQNYKLAV